MAYVVATSDGCEELINLRLSIFVISLKWNAKMTASKAIATMAWNTIAQKIALVHLDSPNYGVWIT